MQIFLTDCMHTGTKHFCADIFVPICQWQISKSTRNCTCGYWYRTAVSSSVQEDTFLCSHCDSKRAAMFIARHFVKSTLNGNKFHISFYVPFSSAPFLFSYFSSLLSHFAFDFSSILPFYIPVSYDFLHSTSCLILYRILLRLPILLLLALSFPIS